MSPLLVNVPPRTCASEVVWPSYLQVYSTTTSSRDHVWTWQQQRDPHTEMKCISLGYALYCPRDQSKLGLCYSRLDMMRLVSYPGLSRPVFFIHGSSKTNSGFFPCVSTASGKCWGKNGQGKSLGVTLHKEHSTVVSQACVACKANSKSLACFYIPTYQC